MTTRTLMSLALIAAAGSVAQAQAVKLTAGPNSKLWLEGGSNVHAWECKASAIDATIFVAPTFQTAADFTKAVEKVEVKIPVTNLKCGHDGMDKNVYKALKADAAPQISYILGSFEAVSQSGKDYTIKTVGTLNVAGEERTVTMDVAAERLADGSVTAKGSVPILMTDFGIKPPRAMFGAIRADNKVVVKFEITVTSQTIVAAANQP